MKATLPGGHSTSAVFLIAETNPDMNYAVERIGFLDFARGYEDGRRRCGTLEQIRI